SREALDARAGHIDAATGMQLVGRLDVDGRKSDLASEAASGDNAAIDEIRAAQSQRDGAHGAFVDGIAHDRARDADSADTNFFDAVDREAVPRAGGLELREISFAAGTETEVAADADLLDLERRHEELV